MLDLTSMSTRDDAEFRNEEPVELTEYLRVIRERWWAIVAAVVIVVGAALFISLETTPQYRSYARLLYQKNNLEQALFGAQVFTASNQDREVQTGAVLVKLEPIAQAASAQVGLNQSAGDLLGMVSVKAESNTNVVDIVAEGPNAEQTALVANAFAEQFVLFRQQTDRATVAAARELVKERLDSLPAEEAASEYGLMLKDKYESLHIIESMQNGGFTIVQRASVPTDPFSPQTVRNTLLALFVGLVLGVGLTFLLDRLDRRLRDEKMLERELGVPVLASIPLVHDGWLRRAGRLTGKEHERSKQAIGFTNNLAMLESFRTLRSNLQYFSLDKQHPVWLITSCAPREGKTTTAINLGLSLALSGKRVILLEADMRRPMINEYLGLERSAGLSNVLAGAGRLEDVLQYVKAANFLPPEKRVQPDEQKGIPGLQRNMYAVSSGPLPPNPAELLSSQRMTDLVEELSPMADYLLIDTPPILAVSDALTLARLADGVIVVASINGTNRDSLHEVRDIFERAGTRILGAVAAGTSKPTGYYKKRYGYGYGYKQAAETIQSEA